MKKEASIELRREIHTFIMESQHASFATLRNVFPKHFNGEYGMPFPSSLKQGRNIWLWSGMTKEFVDALVALLRDGEIYMSWCEFLVYLADGACPTMPLARKPPKDGYKKDHWCPVTFSTMITKSTIAVSGKKWDNGKKVWAKA